MLLDDRNAPTAGTDPQPDEVMFSAAVRAEQACRGSREAMRGGLRRDALRTRFPRTLSLSSASGTPPILRPRAPTASPTSSTAEGPPGFLKVLDEHTVAFAEYAGNRQYISIGNLAENERSFLFLMDYANARRLKLWGRARVTRRTGAACPLCGPGLYGPGRAGDRLHCACLGLELLAAHSKASTRNQSWLIRRPLTRR